jgi:hypothetical protein
MNTIMDSSLNVFDDGAVLLGSVFWTLSTDRGYLDRTDPTQVSPEDEGRTVP